MRFTSLRTINRDKQANSTVIYLVEMGKGDIHLMAKVYIIKIIRKKLIKYKQNKNTYTLVNE